MAEKREWTRVSQLVGQVEFAVSGGKEGSADYVPPTKGFVIKVTYSSDTEMMKNALNSTRIAVQNTMRTFYRKNKRFPFKPGVVQAVSGDGEFTLPMTVHMDKLEAQAAAGQLDREDKIRLARIAGIPEEMIAQLYPAQVTPSNVSTNDDQSTSGTLEESDDGFKYDEEALGKLSLQKLRQLAQDEELEGYDELTKDEIVEELALIEK